MTSNYARFLQNCCACGRPTNKQYARSHEGLCKGCAEGVPTQRQTMSAEERNELLIDHGYQAIARERGDYDIPDCY